MWHLLILLHNNRNIIDSLSKNRSSDNALNLTASDVPQSIIESLNRIISDSNNIENYKKCFELLVCNEFDYSEENILEIIGKIEDETIPEDTRISYLSLLNLAMKNTPDDFEVPRNVIISLCKLFPNSYAIGIVAKIINLKIPYMNVFLNYFGGKTKCFKKLNYFLVNLYNSEYVSDEFFELCTSICSYKMLLIQLIPLFLEIIRNTPKFNVHFQIRCFELLFSFCDDQITLVRILLKNDNLNLLFSKINEDKELLEVSFKFSCSVVKNCDDVNFFIHESNILKFI